MGKKKAKPKVKPLKAWVLVKDGRIMQAKNPWNRATYPEVSSTRIEAVDARKSLSDCDLEDISIRHCIITVE